MNQTTTIGCIHRKNAKVYYTEHSGRYIGEVLQNEEYKYVVNYLSLKSDNVIVDVGANIGTFAFYVYDVAKAIYSIEPVLSLVDVMNETIRENQLDKIKVYALAISDKTGRGYLNIVKPEEAGGCFLHKDGTREVYTMTLNDFCRRENIEHIDLLKLDVEGGEFDILKNTDFNMVDISVIAGEYHAGRINRDDFFQFLWSKGYKAIDYDGYHFIAHKQ